MASVLCINGKSTLKIHFFFIICILLNDLSDTVVIKKNKGYTQSLVQKKQPSYPFLERQHILTDGVFRHFDLKKVP